MEKLFGKEKRKEGKYGTGSMIYRGRERNIVFACM